MGSVQEPLPGMTGLAFRQPSIEEVLLMAVEKSAGIDTIERIVALKQRMEIQQAEADFNDAMSKVQAELSPIRANLENPETHSKYASYAQLDRVLRPIYTKHGFALSFTTVDCPIPDHVRVVCYVSRGGYTRPYQVDICADGKGPKGGAVMTKTHASGSAMSYGNRYLLKGIFNVAIGENDNDGNGDGIDISEDLEFIANSKDIEELKKFYFPAYKRAQSAGDKSAMQRLLSAQNKRKAELS